MDVKGGCDGSSGQNEFMQNINEAALEFEKLHELTEDDPLEIEGEEAENYLEFSEKHVFLFSIVPLRLVGTPINANSQKVLFWENPRPSSTRFCRPLKFLYIKETAKASKREMEKVRTEIENLRPCQVDIDGEL